MSQSERNNHRRSKRRVSGLFVRLLEADSGAYFGDVVNISDQGVKLTLPAARAVGSRWSLSIDAAEDLLGRSLPAFQGEVRWCTFDAMLQCYQCGLALTGLSEQDGRALAALGQRFPLDPGRLALDDL